LLAPIELDWNNDNEYDLFLRSSNVRNNTAESKIGERNVLRTVNEGEVYILERYNHTWA